MARRERSEAVLFLGDGLRELLLADLPEGTARFAVRGNCDFTGDAPLTRSLTLGGTSIFLCHGHGQGVKHGLHGLRLAAPREALLVCYGHTHVFDLRAEDGRLYLCPGSLGAPGRCYAVVETGEMPRVSMRRLV